MDELTPASTSLRSRRTVKNPPPRPEVWGVLNVTPDSFSDGGRYHRVEAAVEHARRLLEEGADVVDIGGESSRPPGRVYGKGAATVSVDEEIGRVVPVVERVVALGARVSIDTVKGEVARAAVAAGASLVNDVSMGACDALLAAVADTGVEIVLMHTRDRGRVNGQTTAYQDLVAEVLEELEGAVRKARAAGIPAEKVWIDPGIGFAKRAGQSAALLGNLDAFVESGYPVLVGASRKSFIAELVPGRPPPAARLPGSLAAAVAATLAGCRAIRVHDVAETVQAVRVAEAMLTGRSAGR